MSYLHPDLHLELARLKRDLADHEIWEGEPVQVRTAEGWVDVADRVETLIRLVDEGRRRSRRARPSQR